MNRKDHILKLRDNEQKIREEVTNIRSEAELLRMAREKSTQADRLKDAREKLELKEKPASELKAVNE